MHLRRFFVYSALLFSWLLLVGGSASARDLDFNDRVRAQEAIERIYYSHQLGATKPFEEAVPREVLEEKVRTYLKQSVALGEHWKTPITARALERELERMARNTRLPDRLREIYSALGTDRQLILECLARPALADRLARNFFAFDQRIHGTERQKAEGMRERLLMGELSPKEDHPLRTVVEFVRIEPREESQEEMASSAGGEELTTPARIELESPEYSRHRMLAAAEVGAIGPLTDEREAFLLRIVLAETPDSFSLASYAVPKISWDEWWARSAPVLDDAADFPGEVAGSGNIPMPGAGQESDLYDSGVGAVTEFADGAMAPVSCVPEDTWSNGTLADPPELRRGHTAVWTGTQMIVWGGYDGTEYGYSYLNSGGWYDPATYTWAPTSTTNAPAGRSGHTAVWTGTQMIIWGGYVGGTGELDTGGRYDPTTDTWAPTSTTSAPAGRSGHTAVWTGTQMIVWGGYVSGNLNSGGRYDPTTDTWAPTSPYNGRSGHTAVWTGTRMIVWGGYVPGTGEVDWGGRYDPATDTWSPTSITNAPARRSGHTAVWTGTQMIVWGGGYGSGYYLNSGGRYDPATNSWSPTSTTNTPAERSSHSAVWTGTQMIIWGGYVPGTGEVDWGGRYDPATDTWSPTSITNAPARRSGHTAVWTGNQMIVWGGYGSGFVNYHISGGRYDPATDTWAPTSTTNAPAGRSGHTAVWTGTQMIVWGGWGGGDYLNSGGRYDPITDTWSPTSTINAPQRRRNHTSVWTGTQMIVWGGLTGGGGDYLSSGSWYDPTTDTWAPTSTTNAPMGRAGHTAVWTGAVMIVWGGERGLPFSSGGRYDPSTDTWSPTATTNAPARRTGHTAVWTGAEMIVWGGLYGGTLVDSGGRYDPATNTWSPTTHAPVGSYRHTAVWTGTHMIVWGGFDYPDDLNSGGRYDPTTDTWTPTSITNAPAGRSGHTAIWTGTQMIVWGGVRGGLYPDYPNSGGRYSPDPSFDPPIADAGPDRAVECARADGTVVELHGTGTGCGSLVFTWTGPFAEGGGSVQGSEVAVTVPLGRRSITLRVDDSHGQSATDTVMVSVVDTVAPEVACPPSLLAECAAASGTLVSVPPATVSDACDPHPLVTNSHTGAGADASGLYPLGETAVTVTSEDQSGNRSTCASLVTVRDTTPPTLTILADPPYLWPPNHKLVPVNVAWQVRDVCDPNPAVALVAVTSSEPDDATGLADGNTPGDIAGADLGTPDGELNLRAERGGTGPGRVYQVTYRAIDASGNTTSAFGVVTVPHDRGKGAEPLLMSLEPNATPGMVHISWPGITGALGYDVISGDLSEAKVENHHLSLGAVRVLARGTTETSWNEGTAGVMPAPGTALFYLIQSRTDHGGGGYGTESAPWPRVPASCEAGCP